MSVQITQWQSQLALAKNALISGDYLTAEDYLTAAMNYSHEENAPEDAVADIFYHRGICFENKDRFVDARRAFNQAQHTFARCLGATSSQAIRAGKAKCLVDIKMGRTVEAQTEFQEIIELLKKDPGHFAAEIIAMESEMHKMLSHPEPPAIPGTEVEIEEYAESWTPVRRPDSGFPQPVNYADRVIMPAEVSEAIAHLSRSGQMAAVPESYVNGGVTGRLTSIETTQILQAPYAHEHARESNAASAQAAVELARAAAAESERKIAEETAHVAAAEAARRQAEEESRNAADVVARLAAEEEVARAAVVERARREEEEHAAQLIAEEIARKAAADEAARVAAEEHARRLADEEARLAIEEAARVAAEELARKEAEDARFAAEEAARKAEEEARYTAEEAARKAEEEARVAAEESARKAEDEARIAAEEAARKAEEDARFAAQEAARKAEDDARFAAQEAARKAEDDARLAAQEAARKAEDDARLAAQEAARKAEDDARLAAQEAARKAEDDARLAAQEAARKAEDDARLAAQEAARKAESDARIAAEESARKSEDEARVAAEEAARKSEEARAAEKTARKSAELAVNAKDGSPTASAGATGLTAEEQSRLEADELARKTDEEARIAAAKIRRAAEEEARLASAEAARKAREEKAAQIEEKKPSALFADYEFDNNNALTGAASLANDFHDSWVPMPFAESSKMAPPRPEKSSSSPAPDVSKDPDVQSEAVTAKRPEGTMIDLPAIAPPALPPELHPDFVTARQPYPAELERRTEPPVKPESQPERRASLLAQVADELSGQLANQIESQSAEKLAAEVATKLAAQVAQAAHAADHLTSHTPPEIAQPIVAPSISSPPVVTVESATWSEVIAQPQGPVGSAPSFPAPPTSFNPRTVQQPQQLNLQPSQQPQLPQQSPAQQPQLFQPAQQQQLAHPVETPAEGPKRNLNRTMVDMNAAGEREQAVLAANAPAKNVDVVKLNEFQQRLSESVGVSETKNEEPSLSSPVITIDPAAPLKAPLVLQEPESTVVVATRDDAAERSRRPSSSRIPKPASPVSQAKSLITPRQFIRPLNIPELTHPRESLYSKVTMAVVIVMYALSALCGIGFVLVPFFWILTYVGDGIQLGKIRGNGIRVTPEQFPEVFEAVHILAASLGMPTAPETYVVYEHGLINACAQRLHGKDIVIIYTEVLEMAYSFGESELAFVISHELAHIQCGHLSRGWVDKPIKKIPFLGNALSRAREYTCDKIAQELVPEGASMGLVALAAGTKLYRRINLKALYAQQDSDENFWTSFSELFSSHPNLNKRIRLLSQTEDLGKSTKSSSTAVSTNMSSRR